MLLNAWIQELVTTACGRQKYIEKYFVLSLFSLF